MTQEEKKQLVNYIYNFAWQYSRVSDSGNDNKIKSHLEEKFILPEEFIERFTKAIEKEKIW